MHELCWPIMVMKIFQTRRRIRPGEKRGAERYASCFSVHFRFMCIPAANQQPKLHTSTADSYQQVCIAALATRLCACSFRLGLCAMRQKHAELLLSPWALRSTGAAQVCEWQSNWNYSMNESMSWPCVSWATVEIRPSENSKVYLFKFCL
jgi:hypothetical protein